MSTRNEPRPGGAPLSPPRTLAPVTRNTET
jgi:hypothetical protein